jgi:hypothetical protein
LRGNLRSLSRAVSEVVSGFPFWSRSVPCALVTNHAGLFWAKRSLPSWKV